MDELRVKEILKKNLLFSDNSIKKIHIFINLLLDFNDRYNLISKSTVESIWVRHILDSAQIIKFIDSYKIKNIADLGSGAGFPGIILALFDKKEGFHVKLYEKSAVKRVFLSKIKEKLDLKYVDIEKNVYDKEISEELIVCRAFKKLPEIMKISREIIKKPHKLIILKGKDAQFEINNLSLGLNYSYKLENSITENDSKIIIVNAK